MAKSSKAPAAEKRGSTTGEAPGRAAPPPRAARATVKPEAPVTGAAIRTAIESRDGRALAAFYAPDALLRTIDRNNPPSRPREVRGKAAIAAFWDDICSRAMTHRVETSVTEGEKLVFSQACTYPDGTKVFCLALCELSGGRIARQTVVQAWDE